MSVLIGHENILAFLTRTADEGRPAHAYLFTGREGVGKKLVAVRFACILNCSHAQDHQDRSCPVCRRIVEEKHPDVTIERPEKGMIRIEQIRNLRSYFRYAPVEGAYRVTILDDAHLMNRSAQNALLKTLEEPPPGRILILVSARPALLLPTVRSRCRRIRFEPIPVDPLADLLERQRGISSKQARVLAAMSGGSMGRALNMEAAKFMELREKIIATLAHPGQAGVREILELSVGVSSDRDKALEAIEIASTWIRDVLIEKMGCDRSTIIHGDFLDRISETAQHHTSEKLLAVYDELIRASEMVEAAINVNRNLITDLTLLRITRMLGNHPWVSRGALG